MIVPQPQKRPHSSLIRFEADLPNETWQTDITHWHLAGGEHAEIMNMIDDHSRLFLASHAYHDRQSPDVVNVFHKATSLHGLPARLLSDNGAVFTATPRKGKVLLQTELERLGITSKNSRPYHPQTCGKIERLHQTLKRYLPRQKPAKGLTELQAQLDAFLHYYNTTRPHRALDGRTPLQAYSPGSRPDPPPLEHSQRPTSGSAKTRSTKGKVTLRHNSRLHHIGIGRAHKGRPIKLLIADRDIRIIDQATGELLRQLTLDPNRDYQPINQH